jgi:hypothetical protein
MNHSHILSAIRTAELGTDEMLTAVEAALQLELHGEIDRVLTMRELGLIDNGRNAPRVGKQKLAWLGARGVEEEVA